MRAHELRGALAHRVGGEQLARGEDPGLVDVEEVMKQSAPAAKSAAKR